MKAIIYASCLIVLLYGCGNSKELEKLRAENEGLKEQVVKAMENAERLEEQATSMAAEAVMQRNRALRAQKKAEELAKKCN